MLIMIPGVTASNFSQPARSFIRTCQMQSRAVRIKNILHADQRKTLGMIFFYYYYSVQILSPEYEPSRPLDVTYSRTVSPGTASP